jgi:hypothetical protein
MLTPFISLKQWIMLVSNSEQKKRRGKKRNGRTSSSQEWKRRIQISINVKILFITCKYIEWRSISLEKEEDENEDEGKKIGMKWMNE